MDFDFRLGLIAFLGGLWVYLLSLIRGITANEPTKPTLLFLGGTHVLTFVYLLLSLYSFYSAALHAISDPDAAVTILGARQVDAILFGTWPIVLTCGACCFVVSRFGLEIGWLLLFIALILVVSAVFFLPLPHNVQLSPVISEHRTSILMFLIVAPVLSVMAIPFVAMLFADVEIETDKEFYGPNESVIVYVNAAGYVFRAQLDTLECGGFQTRVNDRGVFSISPDLLHGDPVIHVQFHPQVIPFKLDKFKRIRIVRSWS